VENIPPLRELSFNDLFCSNLHVSVLLLSWLHHAGVFVERSQISGPANPPAGSLPRWVFDFPALDSIIISSIP
jgi:hypothetical protein